MKIMKIYNSFLIRCWLLRSTSQADRSIFEIEHVQTGERQRVASFAEVENWLLAALSLESEAAQTASPAQKEARQGEGHK